MPRGRSHRVFVDVSLVAILLASTAAPAGSQTYPHQEELWKDVQIGLFLPGVLDDTLLVAGPALLGWSDPFPSGPYLITESRLLAMNLTGEELPMLVRLNAGGPASLGMAQGTAPEPMPAESFFDIFLEIELPTLLPGVSLTNSMPVHALATITQFPPYFETYETAPGAIVALVDQFGEPRGEIRLWSGRFYPYSPPQARCLVETCYGTDEAEQDSLGFVAVSGFVTGREEPALATFSWRPDLPGAPWTEFAVDPDGSDEIAATFFDSGTGDGWTGYFDSALIGPLGSYVDFKVEFQMPTGGTLVDSLQRWIKSQPLKPEVVSCPPESLLITRLGELLKIGVKLLEPHSRVDSLRLWAFPFPLDKHRELTPVDQFGISGGRHAKLDSSSCGPAALASCLKYFADHGYPKLEHPNWGNLSKPALSPSDLAWELQWWLGTTRKKGTSTKGMVAGAKEYAAAHGCPGWTAAYEPVDDYSDVAGMFREFEADGEDVIMLLEDPPDATGKKKSHYVTLGSKASQVWHYNKPPIDAMGVSYRLDFMDPAGGGPTSEHEYDIGENAQGQPTVTGYEGFRAGGQPPARIKGYVKISPPAAGGSGSVFPTAGASLSPGWILADAVRASGDGVVDTLTWDTNGFGPGLHLLMIVASSPDGRENSVIVLGGIPEITLDAPGATPPHTGLRGALPNPTGSSAVIEFALVTDGPVDLTVYDVQGRAVRRLLAGAAYPAGVHRIAWDGKGDDGAAVGSGVYFCRFRAAGVKEEGKIVVVR